MKSDTPVGAQVADDLDEVSQRKVAKHELGHFVDHMTGWQKLPASKDLRLNLRELYHGGVHGFGDRRGYDAGRAYTNPKYMTGPLDVGYPKSDEAREFYGLNPIIALRLFCNVILCGRKEDHDGERVLAE